MVLEGFFCFVLFVRIEKMWKNPPHLFMFESKCLVIQSFLSSQCGVSMVLLRRRLSGAMLAVSEV